MHALIVAFHQSVNNLLKSTDDGKEKDKGSKKGINPKEKPKESDGLVELCEEEIFI